MILDSFKEEKERVIDRSSLEAFYRVKDPSRKINLSVRQDIEEAIRMSDDLEFTRAKTENDLIRAFTFEDLTQKQVENVINDWINLRITDMKSKPEYKQLEDTEFKHIMINRLISNVINELGLYKLSDNARSYEELVPLNPKETYAYSNDVANKNNLNHIMQNALGYDNLVERLQQPEKSGELAQKNFAEQLLAEYYIDKRKDYRASKDLLKALDNEFKSTHYMDQTKRIGQDLNYQFAKRSKPNFIREDDGLAQYGNANYNGQRTQEMHMEDNSKLIKLGDDTNLAMFGDTQGVAENLSKYKDEAEKWPEILPKFDVRRKPKQWVEEKLNEVLKELFTAREHIEQNVEVSVTDSAGKSRNTVLDRHLSRNELKTFDKNLAKHLNKENMVMRLLHELDKEFSELNQKRSDSKFKKQIDLNNKVQSEKNTNEQALFNRSMKNEDAAYKLIAYRIARHYHPEKDKLKPDSAFDFYYEKQLQRDIFEAPRPIVEEDYQVRTIKSKLPEDEESLRRIDEEKKMYVRQDIKIIIDQYLENKELRQNADSITKTFLNDFFKQDKNSDFKI